MEKHTPVEIRDLVVSKNVLAGAYTKDFHIVTFFYGKSSSPNWDLVQNLCQQATLYAYVEECKVTAAFWTKDVEKLKVLREVIRLASDWKGFMLFIDGQQKMKTPIWYREGHGFIAKSVDWLTCYISSFDAKNSIAYCTTECRVHSGPISVGMEIGFKPRLLQLPCQLIRYFNSEFNFEFREGIPMHDTIEAYCARQGLAQCPNFNMQNFEIIKDEV